MSKTSSNTPLKSLRSLLCVLLSLASLTGCSSSRFAGNIGEAISACNALLRDFEGSTEPNLSEERKSAWLQSIAKTITELNIVGGDVGLSGDVETSKILASLALPGGNDIQDLKTLTSRVRDKCERAQK